MQRYDINNYEIDYVNKRIIDIDTGEIIDDNDKIISMLKDFGRQIKQDKATKQAISEMIGIIHREKTVHFNWEKGSYFIKIFRTELREYNQRVELSPDEGLFLFCIQTYVEYETNRIAFPNGKSFNNKDLQELTGLGRNKTEKVMKTLEEKHFIKRVGKGKARDIYFNPHLMCAGREVLYSTENLFNDYSPITKY